MPSLETFRFGLHLGHTPLKNPLGTLGSKVLEKTEDLGGTSWGCGNLRHRFLLKFLIHNLEKPDPY